MYSKPSFLRLAAVAFPLAVPALSFGGLAFHVSSTSAKAESTASSSKPAIYKQQCTADPTVSVLPDDLSGPPSEPVFPPTFNDSTSYIVGFTGTMTWSEDPGQTGIGGMTFDSFSPDLKGIYTPGSPSEGGFTPDPMENSSGTGGSVQFEGYYSKYYSSGILPPTKVDVDQDLIVGNFDTPDNTTGSFVKAHYTVSFTSLTIVDQKSGGVYVVTNPDLPEGNPAAWDPATTFTGSIDPNVPEPATLGLLSLGGFGLLARRKR